MLKSDFHYSLPLELIAQYPVEPRTASRLLGVEGERLVDRMFSDLPLLLRVGDLLVFNDTRVIPARLFGTKETGGRVELLVERILDAQRALAQIRASKPLKLNQELVLDGDARVRVVARRGEFYEFEVDAPETVSALLERSGHIPLPPYITRNDETADCERYQTVYARAPGAVAAPTAGLHFDQALLGRLQDRGVEFAYVTLHVGAGTFQPLRSEKIEEAHLHTERLCVSTQTCVQVNRAKHEGRRVIAIGTTVVRALEAAARENRIEPIDGETGIFIYPGYRFRIVDALLTNFHLPESSLLMLVCAFAGVERVLIAYRHAVAQQYRFYSYGDAMFVTPQF